MSVMPYWKAIFWYSVEGALLRISHTSTSGSELVCTVLERIWIPFFKCEFLLEIKTATDGIAFFPSLVRAVTTPVHQVTSVCRLRLQLLMSHFGSDFFFLSEWHFYINPVERLLDFIVENIIIFYCEITKLSKHMIIFKGPVRLCNNVLTVCVFSLVNII